MKYFKHPNALVASESIGEKTKIWAFTNILPNAVIGDDCNICDHVFIENDVVIGNRVTIKVGVQIWDGITIEDDVFIGPNATFTNDLFPRSKAHLTEPVKTLVRSGASIGANSTILAGCCIGTNSMVGAGSVVTKDVPPNAIVVGNPARITGYTSTVMAPTTNNVINKKNDNRSQIDGVVFYSLPEITDIRGSLSFAEYGQYLPFECKRFFLVYDVPNKEVRGEHAHKELHQYLICVKGSCTVMLDNGELREEYILDESNSALHIPPMVWGVQYKYSADAVLLVLASDVYDADDYVRDYDEFIKLTSKK